MGKAKGKSGTGFRADGWVNMLTALGVANRDKRLGATFHRDIVSEEDAEELWRGNDMAARAVESVPGEIARAGWTLQVEAEPEADPESQGGPISLDAARRRRDLATAVFPDETRELAKQGGKEIAESVRAYMDDLDVLSTFRQAMEYERAYGGSAILLGARDGLDLRKPLDLRRVQSLDFLTVLQPRELTPYRWHTDPRKKDYGKPELYRLQRETAGGYTAPTEQYVHATRVIRFDGVQVSRRQLRQQKGWGDSILVRMSRVLSDFGQTWEGTAVLLADFSQAIFKIKGLAESLNADEDDAVVKRAQLVDLCRSIARAVLIDQDEDFRRETTNVAGLPDLLDRFCNRLAAAARIPVTVLMGQAPAGLNATGASDIRWWYDSIAAEREQKTRPRLNYFTKVLFAAKNGPTRGREPSKWEWIFGPLWQLDALQEATRRQSIATADVAYVTAGVLMAEEVAASRFGGDTFGEEIVLNREIREAFEQEEDEAARAEAEAAKAAARAAQTSAQPKPPGSTMPPKPAAAG